MCIVSTHEIKGYTKHVEHHRVFRILTSSRTPSQTRSARIAHTTHTARTTHTAHTTHTTYNLRTVGPTPVSKRDAYWATALVNGSTIRPLFYCKRRADPRPNLNPPTISGPYDPRQFQNGTPIGPLPSLMVAPSGRCNNISTIRPTPAPKWEAHRAAALENGTTIGPLP